MGATGFLRAVVGAAWTNRFSQSPDRCSEVSLAEYGCATDERVGSCSGAFGGGLGINSAIDFKAKPQAQFASPCCCLLDFWKHLFNEVLATKAGVNGHNEKQIDLCKERFDCGDGRGRIDDEPDLHTQGTDFPEQRWDASFEFDMDRKEICAGGCKRLEEYLWSGTHQVHVERPACQRAQLFQQSRSEGQVRHKMPIHDVQMEPVSSRFFGARDFGAESRVIGRKQRRRDDHARGD